MEVRSGGTETFKVTAEHGAEARVEGGCTAIRVPWQSEAPAKCIKIEGHRGDALVAARKIRLRRPGSKGG